MKLSFIWYLITHPHERFWQALRNWSEYNKIYGEKFVEDVDDCLVEDTFYK